MHKSHSVKEPQTACHTDQLSIDNGRQIPYLLVTQRDLPIGVCWLPGSFSYSRGYCHSPSMEKPYRTDPCSSRHHETGECWGDLNVSTVILLCRISINGSESLKISEDRYAENRTLVILVLSSSGLNLNALTATLLPFQSLFQRSVYPRVARGISSPSLKFSLIKQRLGSLPSVPQILRSKVNATLLRSAGISGCWRICGDQSHQNYTKHRAIRTVGSINSMRLVASSSVN